MILITIKFKNTIAKLLKKEAYRRNKKKDARVILVGNNIIYVSSVSQNQNQLQVLVDKIRTKWMAGKIKMGNRKLEDLPAW